MAGRCMVLDLAFGEEGQRQVISPVLLEDQQEVVLVDCGYPGFVPLEQAMLVYGIPLARLTKLIVTHHDFDHMGSLAELQRRLPQLQVIAYESEKPYIEGSKKSLRVEQAESTLGSLSGEARAGAESFIKILQSMETCCVDQTVTHGEVLPWCGGLEVIHTPGHMPGHISLFHRSSRTLIAADAVVVEEGRLELANPHYTLDLPEAVRSVERLLSYEAEQLVCYHGGLYTGDIRGGLRRLAQNYKSGDNHGVPI